MIPPLNKMLNRRFTRFTWIFDWGILIGVFYYWLIWKTSLGFDLRATGSNPIAAKFSGIDPGRLIILAMVISGSIAGFVGMRVLQDIIIDTQ